MKRNDGTIAKTYRNHWDSRERGVAQHQCRKSRLQPTYIFINHITGNIEYVFSKRPKSLFFENYLKPPSLLLPRVPFRHHSVQSNFLLPPFITPNKPILTQIYTTIKFIIKPPKTFYLCLLFVNQSNHIIPSYLCNQSCLIYASALYQSTKYILFFITLLFLNYRLFQRYLYYEKTIYIPPSTNIV
jgi:hypothetical protein